MIRCIISFNKIIDGAWPKFYSLHANLEAPHRHPDYADLKRQMCHF